MSSSASSRSTVSVSGALQRWKGFRRRRFICSRIRNCSTPKRSTRWLSWVSAGPLLLPHDAVLFEVADRGPAGPGSGRIRPAVRTRGWRPFCSCAGDHAKRWTDVHCHAWFRGDGVAETETNPRLASEEDPNRYARVLTASRLALARPAVTACRRRRKWHVPRTRRPKLARAGVRAGPGISSISTLRASALLRSNAGGTHASPRWHIRRGHWRTLGDGRRVFVRACEVGDTGQGRRRQGLPGHGGSSGMNDFTPSDTQAPPSPPSRTGSRTVRDKQQVFRLFGYAGTGKSTAQARPR